MTRTRSGLTIGEKSDSNSEVSEGEKSPHSLERGTQWMEGRYSEQELDRISRPLSPDRNQIRNEDVFTSAVSSHTYNLATPALCKTVRPPDSSPSGEKGEIARLQRSIDRRSSFTLSPAIRSKAEIGVEVYEEDLESELDCEEVDRAQQPPGKGRFFETPFKAPDPPKETRSAPRSIMNHPHEHWASPPWAQYPNPYGTPAYGPPPYASPYGSPQFGGHGGTFPPSWGPGPNQSFGHALIAPAPMSLPMPALQDRLQITDHLEALNETLTEMGYVVEGHFRPGMTTLVRNLVVDSLKAVPEVQRFASGPGKRHLAWPDLQALLVQEFASIHHIRQELDSKLKSLTLKRPTSAFLSAIREIYHLHSLFYKSDGGMIRSLVNRVLELIPPAISTEIVRELYCIDSDWQRALPFAEGPRTFMTLLEMKLSSQEIVENLQRRRANHQSQDKINLVYDKKKPWLKDWCDMFQGVLYCNGPNHLEEVERLAEVDRSVEVKIMRKGRSGPYALVGYKGAAPRLSCNNKPFELREREGSDGAQAAISKNL